MANNKRIVVFNSKADMYRVFHKNAELAKKYDTNSENSAIEEINASINILHSDNYMYKNSDAVYLNNNN